MLRPTGTLAHEVEGERRADPVTFDHQAYAVGRAVLAPDLLRELRAPLVDALLTDGHVELVDEDEDRVRWIGKRASFDAARYREIVQEPVEELLVGTGAAARAIEAIWGRPAALWGANGARLMAMAPGDPTRVHRDGWQMMGHGGPRDHVNLWIPLTVLGERDGTLAIAIGSHQIADQPPEVTMLHPIHLDAVSSSRQAPSAEQLAPLWRTTSFEVGDALLFRPGIVHSAAPNDGPYLRLALVLTAQDAGVPMPPEAGLSADRTRDLTDVEWLTLALLALQPTTPWLARCAFYPRGVVGRLWTQPPDDLVDRSFATLQVRGLVEPYEDGGDRAAIHRYHVATQAGRAAVSEWLTASAPRDSGTLGIRMLLCDWMGLDKTTLLVAGSAIGRG